MTTKSTAKHTPGFEAFWYDWRCKHGKSDTAKQRELAIAGWDGALSATAAERDRLREENASLIETLERVTSEVSWFIKRKKNLAEIIVDDNGVKVWADVLDEDLDIARAALARHAKAEGRS